MNKNFQLNIRDDNMKKIINNIEKKNILNIHGNYRWLIILPIFFLSEYCY